MDTNTGIAPLSVHAHHHTSPHGTHVEHRSSCLWFSFCSSLSIPFFVSFTPILKKDPEYTWRFLHGHRLREVGNISQPSTHAPLCSVFGGDRGSRFTRRSCTCSGEQPWLCWIQVSILIHLLRRDLLGLRGARNLPSTGVRLLRPLGCPSHDRRRAVRREVLVEHHAVPVSNKPHQR